MKKTWIVVLIIIAIAGGVTGTLYNQAKQEINRFEKERPLPAAVLYDQQGQVIKRLGKGTVYVPINKIPQHLQNAVLATENKAGKGTAINQRVADSIFQPKNTWDRLKAKILPYLVNRHYSNRELLEIYLNNTYFGKGAHGVEAASETYFGKSVQEIELAESALLAALALEPEAASPFEKPKRAQELRNNILEQMHKEEKINRAEYDKARNTPIAPEEHEPGQAHYFADYLSKLLVEKLGEEQVFQGGLKVETTIDLQLQELAEKALKGNELQGAVVVLDLDGNILAMVGGSDYIQHKTNLAVVQHNEVGSSLRPLIYATGLREDWAMNHLVEDVQRKFGDFEIKNSGDRYWGTVTMKHALALDLNNAAVWTLNELGTDKFSSFLAKVGIKMANKDQDLNLAVGVIPGGISLLELTAAYLPAAAKGIYREPKGFHQVKDQQDKIILKQDQASQRALTEQEAYLLTDMLMAGQEKGSTRELSLSFPLAVTASTSQDGKTQWAIGYTPYFLAGVVIEVPEQSEEEVPPLLAGKVWVEFMNEAMRTKEERDFEVPDNVETGILIDIFTGLLANERCPQVEVDAFITGTKPTRNAPCANPPPPPPPPIQQRPAAPTPPPIAPQQPEPEPPVPPLEQVPEEEPPLQPEPIEPVEPEPEPAPPPPPPEQPLEPETPPSEPEPSPELPQEPPPPEPTPEPEPQPESEEE